MISMLKLVTSDDIIGEAEFHDHHWHVKKVVRVIYAPQGIAMIPYDGFYKKSEFKIHEDHVVFHGEVSEEIHNAYSSKFGGIVLGKAVPGLKLVGEDDD